MKKVLMIISFTGLLLTLLPSVLVFAALISWRLYLNLMAAGTLIWFITAPMWMKKEDGV